VQAFETELQSQLQRSAGSASQQQQHAASPTSTRSALHITDELAIFYLIITIYKFLTNNSAKANIAHVGSHGAIIVKFFFHKNLFTTKSSGYRSFLHKLQTSNPYSKVGIHLVFSSSIKTSSEAILPILPKMLFAAR